MQPTLQVIVPGWGAPHKEHKEAILRSNLALLRAHPWSALHVTVHSYDSDPLENLPHPVTWIREPGVTGDFLRRHPAPTTDYVLILLDDVELQPNFDMARILAFQQRFQFDLLSPTLTGRSRYQFEFMRTQPFDVHDIKVVPCCETFCLFFPVASYRAYVSRLSPENPWTWGVDMLLYKVFGFRVGLLNHITMHHHYKGDAYGANLPNPYEGRAHEYQKYGLVEADVAAQCAVHYWIQVNPEHLTSPLLTPSPPPPPPPLPPSSPPSPLPPPSPLAPA